MVKKYVLAGIGLVMLLGIVSLNGMTQAKADENQNSGGVVSLTHAITSIDLANSVVIGPVTPQIFTMIFKTTSDYNGKAVFQSQKDDGTWVSIGPSQVKGATSVDGADSISATSLKVPLTMRVLVIQQATIGQSLVELDYVGSQQTNSSDDVEHEDQKNNQENHQK